MAMFIALLSGLGAMHPDSKNVTAPESRAFHIRRLIAAALDAGRDDLPAWQGPRAGPS